VREYRIMAKFCVYVAPRLTGCSKSCWYFWKKIFVCNFHLVFFRNSGQTHWLLKSKYLSFSYFKGYHNPCLVLNLARPIFKTTQKSRKWLIFWRNSITFEFPLHCCLLKKRVILIWVENKSTQLCLQCYN